MSESPDNQTDQKDALVRVMVNSGMINGGVPILSCSASMMQKPAKRMNRILVLRLLLDRAVTAILTTKVVDHSSATYSYADFAKIEVVLTFIDMEDRIELANASGLISDSCASNMRTVNTIRNKLAHYQPK